MKKKSLISIVVVCVFLLSGIGLAGVEPTPFTPYINQLDALVNILNSALDRVEKVMGVEPGPFNPIGAVNKLEAIDNQLTLANDMVVSIAEEVMGVDPNPFSGDLGLAFEDVQTAAQNIVSFINGIIDIPDQLTTAIGHVKNSADAIVGTVDEYLLGVTCPCWQPSDLNSVTSDNLASGSCPGDNYPFVIANVVGSTPGVEGGFGTVYEYYGPGVHRCSTRDYPIVLEITDEEYLRCAEQIADRCTDIGFPIQYPQ